MGNPRCESFSSIDLGISLCVFAAHSFVEHVREDFIAPCGNNGSAERPFAKRDQGVVEVLRIIALSQLD